MPKVDYKSKKSKTKSNDTANPNKIENYFGKTNIDDSDDNDSDDDDELF